LRRSASLPIMVAMAALYRATPVEHLLGLVGSVSPAGGRIRPFHPLRACPQPSGWPTFVSSHPASTKCNFLVLFARNIERH
jgi:hypothetical protein